MVEPGESRKGLIHYGRMGAMPGAGRRGIRETVDNVTHVILNSSSQFIRATRGGIGCSSAEGRNCWIKETGKRDRMVSLGLQLSCERVFDVVMDWRVHQPWSTY